MLAIANIENLKALVVIMSFVQAIACRACCSEVSCKPGLFQRLDDCTKNHALQAWRRGFSD
jgi:hypothetical protein